MVVDNHRALIIDVNLLGSHWHGVGDWPPSPFRVYQALVAGAYGGRWCAEDRLKTNERAFFWLERLKPPIVLAPLKRKAIPVQYFVPDNDLDAVENDLRRVGKIRAKKNTQAIMFEGEPRFSFIWAFDDGEEDALRIVELCGRLHHFGRGIDPAYAVGTVTSADTVEDRVKTHKGVIARPNASSDGLSVSARLPCPTLGSLDSLRRRFAMTNNRFSRSANGRMTYFQQPPKAHFRLVSYDRPPRRFVFELRKIGVSGGFYPIRIEHAVMITKALRDLAFNRLVSACDDQQIIEKLILGRGAGDAEKPQRVRFVPLPSIGSRFTDSSIRRMLVEMPADCPILEADLRWALAGQHVPVIGFADIDTAEGLGLRLAETRSKAMLWHYGLTGAPATRWQTVTPIVLPNSHHPIRMSGSARVAFETDCVSRVLSALRHSGLRSHSGAPARATAVSVRREPFFARGSRADSFEPDRFSSRQLFHIDLQFADAVFGPVTLGDGRWLGFGLMRPIRGDDSSSEAGPVGELEQTDDGDDDDIYEQDGDGDIDDQDHDEA